VPLRHLALLLLAAASAPLPLGAQTRPAPGAEIVFLDVGQGDAILIRSDTFNILIDTGRSRHIMRDLLGRGVHHIHLLIASHNHDDHIGDMDDVVRNMMVDEFIDNTCRVHKLTQDNLLYALRRKHIRPENDDARTLAFGGLSLEILPSPFRVCDPRENNTSVGVLVRVGHFSALLTGDSEADELNAWMQEGVIPDVDVLKAAHHGARNGVTPGWILATRPEVVVISVGANNTYGHPEEAALRYYQSGGRDVFRTDEDGTVLVCIAPDGEYQVHTEVNEPKATCSVKGR